MHLIELFVKPGAFLFCLLDLLFSLLNFLAYCFELALVFKRFQRAASFLHDLSESGISQKPCNHIASIAEVLNSLYIGLHFLLELFDLSLILCSKFLNSSIELFVLMIFLLG